MRKRTGLIAVLIALVIGGGLFAWGLRNARADPVVRRATITLAGWPGNAPPVKALLLSDIHIGNAAMDEARLKRIVAQVNALKPSLIFLAGDFIARDRPGVRPKLTEALTRALSPLHAPLGVIATLGNHDNATDPNAVAAALRRAGIVVLENEAQERGPLAIGGIGDFNTRHARLNATIEAMRALPGAPILVSHTGHSAFYVPRGLNLVLAGHTHCGQVLLPGIGSPLALLSSRHRIYCGFGRTRNGAYLITAGLGTSHLPIRFGVPPDMWLITFRGATNPK